MLSPQSGRGDSEQQQARLANVLDVFSSSSTHGGYLLEYLFAWLGSAKQKCEPRESATPLQNARST